MRHERREMEDKKRLVRTNYLGFPRFPNFPQKENFVFNVPVVIKHDSEFQRVMQMT